MEKWSQSVLTDNRSKNVGTFCAKFSVQDQES